MMDRTTQNQGKHEQGSETEKRKKVESYCEDGQIKIDGEGDSEKSGCTGRGREETGE
jgi:hypothetical protein